MCLNCCAPSGFRSFMPCERGEGVTPHRVVRVRDEVDMPREAELLIGDLAGLEPGCAGKPRAERGNERAGHQRRFRVADRLADRFAAGLAVQVGRSTRRTGCQRLPFG
jgi:hypothetical protein